MDAIEALARRLPPVDERWVARPHVREELARALVTGRVAGIITHPLDNVRGNIQLLIDGDPDKEFGMPGIGRDASIDEVLDLVAKAAGAPIDHDARSGPVEIAPEPILDACAEMGGRLAAAARDGETVLIATGHPGGLSILYREIGGLLAAHGARLLTPARGARWRAPGQPHDWSLDYLGAVALLTDGREPRHTHAPDAMLRILDRAETVPDLVLADHGFAGAAIEAGIETLSVADVNDTAMLVAKARGRTETVLVMDDHVRPDAYWPCYQAISMAF